jgi:cytochrome c-type biogenesis protein CcmH/NrfG
MDCFPLLGVINRNHMSDDINQEILAEIRKLRRTFKVLLVSIIVGIIVCAAPGFYYGITRGSSQADSWERVRTAMSRQDFPAALSMAQSLVDREPNYDYGHACLGYVYLAMGDITNAEAQYFQADKLFPDEENDKNVAAVRKRLATGTDFNLLSK